MSAKIFISYAHEDKNFATDLIYKLKEEGYRPWLDTQSLLAGDDWQKKIDDGIREASIVVVVMSSHARESEYANYEWAFALGAGITVIPIEIESLKKRHPRLKSQQPKDFTNRTQGSGDWKALIKDLKHILHRKTWENIEPPKGASHVIINLVNDLNDGDPEKREKAVKELGKIGDPIAVEPLEELYYQDTNSPAVRRAIVSALEDIRSDNARDTLTSAINDPDVQVRVRAARA